MIRRPPRSTLFPTRRSSDLLNTKNLAGYGSERSTALVIQVDHQERMVGVVHTHLIGDKKKPVDRIRSEEHTSELQSQSNLVCRLLLEKKKEQTMQNRRRHYD